MDNHTKYGLKSHIIENIQKVFENFSEVEKVILYGSRAKGNYRIGSDIDLTIIGTDIDLSKLNEIENRLDDLMLPYTFDISVFSHIKNDGLLDHIKHVGKEFYIKRN